MKTSTIARRLRIALYILERTYGVTPDSVLGRDLDSVARHLESLPDRHDPSAASSPDVKAERPPSGEVAAGTNFRGEGR